MINDTPTKLKTFCFQKKPQKSMSKESTDWKKYLQTT